MSLSRLYHSHGDLVNASDLMGCKIEVHARHFIIQHLLGHETSDPNGHLVASYKMQGALVT